MFSCPDLRNGNQSIVKTFLKNISKHVSNDCFECKCEDMKATKMKSMKGIYSNNKIIKRLILPKLKCLNCNISFNDSKEQIHHTVIEHECDFCPEYFEDRSSKIVHGITTCGHCYVCGKKSTTTEHLWKEHQRCHICSKVIDVEIEKHISEIHKCKFCDWLTFQDVESRNLHQSNVHTRCDYCGDLHFHENHQIYKCVVCEDVFDSAIDPTRHYYETHRCCFCTDLTFKNASERMKHIARFH